MNNFFLLIIAVTVCFITSCKSSATFSIQQIKANSAQQKLVELEKSSSGRLGIFALDSNNNQFVQYRAEERFPLCSTAKIMVVAAILKESEKDPELLKRQISYSQKDVDKSSYAPVTKDHVVDGMNVADLCEAAIEYSDNTAMNLLMEILGGPKAVTAFARSMGDKIFRLDRIEPDLNTAIPNDIRDTSTPKAMTESLYEFAFGKVLALQQLELLQSWLKKNTTGDTRIRAGSPKNWIVGDKTGTGDYGTTNDLGIIWPPKCKPIVISVYFTQNKKDAQRRDDVIAAATNILIHELVQTDPCIKLNYQ